MIPKACKRLAEVDFPIAEVSRHAAREKSIRHGHPSTLHLWWARRPLASSRAVLLALLWPDPCDPLCPEAFKAEARKRLLEVSVSPGKTDADLRRGLLQFIADFANWDVASHPAYLDVSRALVRAAHSPEDGAPYEPPLVVDPFAGGGSIPLEALRVGCEAFASDLNPVACLILKVILEDIIQHGPQLAEELRRVGTEIRNRAESELTGLYSRDADGATPVAYLWARTVRCEAPMCGAEIPLVRSFWLCRRGSRRRALRHRVVRPSGETPRVEFEVFEPKTEKEVPAGTVSRAKATCFHCGMVLPPERVRAQLAAERGGADVVFDDHGRRVGGATLLAVVTLRAGDTGRQYRAPVARDYGLARQAQERIAALMSEWERSGRRGLCPVPDEPLPPIGTLGFRVQRYGMLRWGDLFTARQKVSLLALARGAASVPATDSARELAAIAVSRLADISNSLCSWKPSMTQVIHVFTRQALPVVWDYAEASALGEQAGDVVVTVRNLCRIAEGAASAVYKATVQQADACEHPLPDESASVWFTDPPYYDAVPYSDLSDFFLVWLKRALPGHPFLRDPFDPPNVLSPKDREAVQDETKSKGGCPKDRAWFEETMARAFAQGRRVLRPDGVGSVVFAHKTTEGWEALLSGMIRGGWTITASWPIATEMETRLRARESAALATSVHLVCRPRAGDAGTGDWVGVLRELPDRVGTWMERLQHEGVRGADLVFACIGPALEIYSRYAHVETADGRDVPLGEYLEKVWEIVGRAALAQVLGTAEARARDGAAGAVEEDARLTALFLWTLQSTEPDDVDGSNAGGDDEDNPDDTEEEDAPTGKVKGFTLVYDVVRRIAQPLGIDLPSWEGRVIETKKGIVRLLPIAERAEQLFGEEGAQAVAARLEHETRLGPSSFQGLLFPELEVAPEIRTRSGSGRGRKGAAEGSDEALTARREATTLDRVHAAMLLQASGRTNGLRALLRVEQERGPDFMRLANALSALYPRGSEEKRLVDAMLLAAPR